MQKNFLPTRSGSPEKTINQQKKSMPYIIRHADKGEFITSPNLPIFGSVEKALRFATKLKAEQFCKVLFPLLPPVVFWYVDEIDNKPNR